MVLNTLIWELSPLPPSLSPTLAMLKINIKAHHLQKDFPQCAKARVCYQSLSAKTHSYIYAFGLNPPYPLLRTVQISHTVSQDPNCLKLRGVGRQTGTSRKAVTATSSFVPITRTWLSFLGQSPQTQAAAQVIAETSFIHLAALKCLGEMLRESCVHLLTIWYSCHQSCLLLQSLGKS